MINFLLKIPLEESFDLLPNHFLQKPDSLLKIELGLNILFLWGDPIISDQGRKELEQNFSSEIILNKIAGHFYYLHYNKSEKAITIGNSLFGILPIYYKKESRDLFVSNKIDLFIGKGVNTFNPRFILENILFNYPLFNITTFNEVKLLPVNSSLLIDKGNYFVHNNFNIEDLFVQKPLSKRKSLNRIVDTFIDASEKYFPEEFYYASLTGGFDGRTLVAKGLSKGKNFNTYGFGSEESQDVIIGKKLANAVGLKYHHFNLDSNYIEKYSLENGLEFIKNAGGTAGFARAHYQYATYIISEESEIMITGNFGSEIFRASHIAGAVISPNLYHLFNAKNFDDAIQKIEESPEWKWLNKSEFKEAKDSLYEELKLFPAFDKSYDDLTKNQKFYKVVFDEVFRKYFGAEMVNQFQVIKNRTPFLDRDFLSTILNSEFAGLYSDFFTHNPLKRFKGQVVYANVLKRTNPTLFKMMTDKSYRPSDILGFKGKFRLAHSFANKKLKGNKVSLHDPYSVHGSFNHNRDFWKSQNPDQHLFNTNAFKDGDNYSNTYSIALSQAWWYNRIKKTL